MVSDRIFHKPLTALLCVAAMACTLAPAIAHADGQPLILDTQKGISDGQKGTVLQNAPLSHEPMVTARQPAAPAGLATDSSQPYIVAPYIALPGGGGSRPNSPHPQRPQTMPQTAPAQ